MGGSKKVTVGHFHDKDMMMALCHGPIDAVTEIRVADRTALVQMMDRTGTYTIDKENLFGGKSQEGGIKGQFDLMMGLPDQPVNPYIQGMAGEQSAYVPAYRRLVTVLLKSMYVGMNPYWRQWLFLGNRIYNADGGAMQWSPEKAAVNANVLSGKIDSFYKYSVKDGFTSLSQLSAYAAPELDDSAWVVSQGPFGYVSGSGMPSPNTSVSPASGRAIMLREHLDFTNPELFGDLIVKMRHDDGGVLFFNGEQITLHLDDYYNSTAVISKTKFKQGKNVLFAGAVDSVPAGSPSGIYLNVSYETEQTNVYSADLNPAHIIREALSSKEWGKGATNIDDVALTKMADQLYAEGLGMSIFWQQSTKVNELLKLVCDHIGAVLPYVDTQTGLWTSRLIRDSEIPENPVHLHDGNINKIRDPKIRKGTNAVNTVHVKYTEVESNSVGVVTANSLSGIAQAGGAVIAETIEYKGFTTQKNAMWACRRDLQTLSARVKSVGIEAHDDVAEDLQKGDFFHWSNRRLGIDRALMMVQEIDYGDYLSNTVVIKAIEYAFRAPQNSVVEYLPPQPNKNQPPLVAEVLVFEAPYREAVQRFGEREVNDQLAYDETSSYLLVAVKRPQDNALGATLFTSVGGAYEESEAIDFCATGQLRHAVGYQDTVFEIKNITDVSALEVGLAIEINGERMHLVDFDSNTREATVIRGIDDTMPKQHAVDSTVWFYDEYAVTDETTYTEHQTVFVKASTLTNTDALGVSAADEHSLVMSARMYRPYPPANAKINDEYWPAEIETDLVVTWVDRNRLQQTAGIPLGWFEGGIAIEANTQTHLTITQFDEDQIELESVSVNATAANSYTYPMSALEPNTRTIEIVLKTVRDGYECLNPFVHKIELSQFFSAPYDLTVEFKND